MGKTSLENSLEVFSSDLARNTSVACLTCPLKLYMHKDRGKCVSFTPGPLTTYLHHPWYDKRI